MIAVPVLSPCAHLQRTQPPDVLAGVAIRMLAEMSEAVDEALHVKRIDETDGADPEKSRPTQESSAENGNDDHGYFSSSPEFVDAAGELGAILLLICRLRLIQPAQMRPPEAAVSRAGNVVGTVRVDVMVAMVGDPTSRRSGTVEHGPEDQKMLNKFIELKGFMRKRTVITNGGAQPTENADNEPDAENLPSGHGVQD